MTNSTVSLKKLLKGSITKELSKALGLKQIKVNGIKIDSRSVVDGQLFIAYPGQSVDGRQFIQSAIENGATAIVAEEKDLAKFCKDFTNLLDDNQQVIAYQYSAIKIVPVPNLAQKVSRIAGKFYGSPSKKMSLVGVTGTNGKTSVCYLVAQALEMMQKPTLLLSTLGNGSIGDLQTSANTTADPITIQQKAAEFLQQNYHHLCMEVSSHGLDQHRVSGLKYSVAVFTNLSHDHLEYHGDMESYFQAKRQLFLRKEIKFVVINAEDLYGQRLLDDPEIKAQKIAYTRDTSLVSEQTEHWVVSNNAQFTLNGISADLTTPWGTGRIRSHLLGDFNLSNLLAVAGILGALQGDLHKWLVALNAAKPVMGRMQQFSKDGLATLVVDYAHTPDALEKALKTLRHHTNGELWCLFGCGGDRDPSKRGLMGKVAETNAEKIIITDDNPRTEVASEIVSMIRQGMNDQTIPYIASRKEAIGYAMDLAAVQDMILVAGKGHEDYQEIGTEKLHYSDLETVQSLLEARS
ncbi:MAG: UDP-N-acetylmuramoyl-L-alanyl-D-glutamate--2,6-diaminopimelate ligase [Gammaproteobacteria bacterium]|nr:UDP-N-acetylmuramoyl-L-alanyl-D-glutamate--2,6-diaminopimelate ligase [Gammaproteobacteria bacterium]